MHKKNSDPLSIHSNNVYNEPIKNDNFCSCSQNNVEQTHTHMFYSLQLNTYKNYSTLTVCLLTSFYLLSIQETRTREISRVLNIDITHTQTTRRASVYLDHVDKLILIHAQVFLSGTVYEILRDLLVLCFDFTVRATTS